MVTCLTATRFNMFADVLNQTGYEHEGRQNSDTVDDQYGFEQDPDSGEIIRRWIKPAKVDDPSTPDVDETEPKSFPCIARGIIDGGIRVAGTTERWDEIYANVDYVRISFGKATVITKRDQVTNIRSHDGQIIWREEEIPGSPPTVFNVMGVTPVLDPFGRHIEWQALLERASHQNA